MPVKVIGSKVCVGGRALLYITKWNSAKLPNIYVYIHRLELFSALLGKRSFHFNREVLKERLITGQSAINKVL